jgi:hypothetical protein
MTDLISVAGARESGRTMEDEIADVVREHGWFAASVHDHDPPFLDSIGLMQTCRHPELIVFGLEPREAHSLLSEVVEEIRAGRSYARPGVYGVPLGEDRRAECTRPSTRFTWASRWAVAGTSGAWESWRRFRFSDRIQTGSSPSRSDATWTPNGASPGLTCL